MTEGEIITEIKANKLFNELKAEQSYVDARLQDLTSTDKYKILADKMGIIEKLANEIIESKSMLVGIGEIAVKKSIQESISYVNSTIPPLMVPKDVDELIKRLESNIALLRKAQQSNDISIVKSIINESYLAQLREEVEKKAAAMPCAKFQPVNIESVFKEYLAYAKEYDSK